MKTILRSIIILACLSSCCYAVKPMFHHKDPTIQREYENVYQNIQSIYGNIDSKTYVSVRAFGAKGNGIDDDTAGIQAAIDFLASTGGTVYFPGATYIISSPIKIRDGVTLLGSGPGSKIKIKDNSNIDMLTNYNYPSSGGGDRSKLISLYFDGNKANNSNNGSMVLYGVNEFSMLYCHIEGGDGTIPLLRNSSYCTIAFNTVKNSATDGITIYDGSNYNTIAFNYVESNSGYGILIQGLEVDGQNVSIGNAIIGNQCLLNTFDGISLLNGANETKVIGNTCNLNLNRGIRLYSDATSVLTSTVTIKNLNNIIQGNTCKNNTNEGILISDDGSTGGGGNDAAKWAVVKGNFLFDDQGSPTQTYGINVQGSSDYIFIEGNAVHDNVSGQIQIGGGINSNGLVWMNPGYSTTLQAGAGGTGTTSSTGSGSVVLNNGPTLSAGTSNDTGYTLATLVGGTQSTLFKSYTTTGVTTSAKTIAASTGQNGSIVFISGNNGSGFFFDIVVIGDNMGTPAEVSKNTTFGSPSTRTYTNSGGALQLTMGSGTYSVHCFQISLG